MTGRFWKASDDECGEEEGGGAGRIMSGNGRQWEHISSFRPLEFMVDESGTDEEEYCKSGSSFVSRMRLFVNQRGLRGCEGAA